MKNLQTFEEFLNEAHLNEAKLPETIEEMEKILPKVIDISEFFSAFDRYADPFRSSLNFTDLIYYMDRKKINLKGFILSQGQYVTHEKKRYYDGYGFSEKPVELKAAYDEMIDDEKYEELFAKTKQMLGNDKFYKKLATELVKQLGALEAAKKVLKYVWSSANGSYDRNLIMDRLLSKYGEKLWYDQKAVRNSVSRGFMSAGQNLQDSPFREYIKNI